MFSLAQYFNIYLILLFQLYRINQIELWISVLGQITAFNLVEQFGSNLLSWTHEHIRCKTDYILCVFKSIQFHCSILTDWTNMFNQIELCL